MEQKWIPTKKKQQKTNYIIIDDQIKTDPTIVPNIIGEYFHKATMPKAS